MNDRWTPYSYDLDYLDYLRRKFPDGFPDTPIATAVPGMPNATVPTPRVLRGSDLGGGRIINPVWDGRPGQVTNLLYDPSDPPDVTLTAAASPQASSAPPPSAPASTPVPAISTFFPRVASPTRAATPRDPYESDGLLSGVPVLGLDDDPEIDRLVGPPPKPASAYLPAWMSGAQWGGGASAPSSARPAAPAPVPFGDQPAAAAVAPAPTSPLQRLMESTRMQEAVRNSSAPSYERLRPVGGEVRNDSVWPVRYANSVIDSLIGMPGALHDTVTMPGRVLRGEIKPSDPGYYDQATNFALNAIGWGSPFAVKGAVGSAGGRPSAPRSLKMDDASRLERAKEMGFRTNMPVRFGTAPAGEAIAEAAINVNGRIFTGRTHLDAMMKAERELGIPFEQMETGAIMDGFVTNSGRYVSRWEAGDIAKRASQGETSPGKFGGFRGLASADIETATRANRSRVRTGATETGLPGGEGVWGSVGSAEGQNAGALWHRTQRPVRMDVQGAQEWEIQANLRDAWDQGYDAVMLQNYVRPGGTKPESVVVVRDPSQIRSPDARFNPTKIHSENILATGGAGGRFMAPLPALSDAEQKPGVPWWRQPGVI